MYSYDLIKNWTLLFLILAPALIRAQGIDEIKLCEFDSIDGEVIHTTVEKLPEYEGGLQILYQQLSSKVRLKGNGNIGCIRVTMSFVIDVEGKIKNFCSTPSIENPQELIESINKWSPGQIGKTKMPVRIYLPMYIKFG